MKGLKAGEVASLAKVNLQTIHYYERRGLLPKPPRTGSNYRLYPQSTVLSVRFIKRAQELGFTLDEIKELLLLRTRPETQCQDMYRRAADKIRDIDEKIEALRDLRQALAQRMAECLEPHPLTGCPILQALEAEKEKP